MAKFYDPNLLDQRKNAYTKTLLGTTRCPLPPELLEHLRNKRSSPNFNKQGAEIWAIGVLMITLATLNSEEVLYNWRTKEIDRRGYEHLLQQTRSRYSQLYYEMVAKCLDFDVNRRPSMPELLRYINTRKSSV